MNYTLVLATLHQRLRSQSLADRDCMHPDGDLLAWPRHPPEALTDGMAIQRLLASAQPQAQDIGRLRQLQQPRVRAATQAPLP